MNDYMKCQHLDLEMRLIISYISVFIRVIIIAIMNLTLLSLFI